MKNNQKIEKIKLAPGYEISRIIKGGWQLAGGHGAIDNTTALKDMALFCESGITTFDCADIYTGVEEMIGEFKGQLEEKKNISTRMPDLIQVHTKFVPDIDVLENISSEYIRSIIDRSRNRLRTESLDLVQLHWWDFESDKYMFTFLELQKLKKEGVIKNIGLTNFDVEHLRKILPFGNIVSNQVQYSLLDNRPENGMVELALQNNFSLICYGTLAGGFLSEKFIGVSEPDMEALENRSLVKYKLIIDEFGGWELFQELLKTLQKVSNRHDVTIGTIASRYILEKPAVAAVIIGARNGDHIKEHKKIFSFVLNESDKNLINEVLKKRKGPAGDIYSVERQKDSRHAVIMKYTLNRS